jgi:RimJ/RimL family protein N-acetyltransferase
MVELAPEVIIRSADIMLRELVDADAEALCEAVNYDTNHFIESGEFPVVTRFSDPATARKNITERRDLYGQIQYGIFNCEGAAMGAVTLGPASNAPSFAEVAFWVGAKYRGNRYAATALSAVASYFFNPIVGGDVLKARVMPSNAASIRTLELANFREMPSEGIPLAYYRRRAPTQTS